MYLRARRTFNEKKINWEDILPRSTLPWKRTAPLHPKEKREDSWDGNRISIRKTRRGALQLLLVDHNLGRAINLFSAMHLSSARKSRNNLRAAHKFATARLSRRATRYIPVMMEMDHVRRDHVAFRSCSYAARVLWKCWSNSQISRDTRQLSSGPQRPENFLYKRR